MMHTLELNDYHGIIPILFYSILLYSILFYSQVVGGRNSKDTEESIKSLLNPHWAQENTISRIQDKETEAMQGFKYYTKRGTNELINEHGWE